MMEGYDRREEQDSGATAETTRVVALRDPDGGRRLPSDIIKQDVLSLPVTTLVVFHGDELGEPAAYAADLMRRLGRLQYRWVGQASLAFLQKPELMALGRQSHCCALAFDGEQISQQYLTTETLATPEALAQLAASLRTLAGQGVLTMIRFVFGYDTDDEGVFERTVRFCFDARIGLPTFSLLTPQSEGTLFAALEREGRLLQKDLACYDGAHAVFHPKLMTPAALENGLYWTRRRVYSHSAIWRRMVSLRGRTVQRLLANYAQRQQYMAGPRGAYTETMRLLKQLSQPIVVREQASFVSTLKDAVGQTTRHFHGALLRLRVIRDEPLKALTLRLEGVLDASGATEVLQRIHQAIRAGHQKIVLDLKGLELVSPTVITRFLDENAQALIALRDRVVFRHLRTALEAIQANLGGVLPNAHLFELVQEEAGN
jgi:hypothetical protein